MKIFITGHKGHIGKQIWKDLQIKAIQLVGYDSKDGQDIHDYPNLKQQMGGADVVIHLAGIPHPGLGNLDKYIHDNVIGTAKVFRAVHENNVRRVIYASSTAFYGCDAAQGFQPLVVPVTEEHEPRPMGRPDDYNLSKQINEDIIDRLWSQLIPEIVVLRIAPCNTKADQYAKDFDPTTCRDWRKGCWFSNCHPEYAARAIRAAAVKDLPHKYVVYNVADKYTHQEVNMQQLVKDANIKTNGRIYKSTCIFDTLRIQQDLGWSPCKDLE